MLRVMLEQAATKQLTTAAPEPVPITRACWAPWQAGNVQEDRWLNWQARAQPGLRLLYKGIKQHPAHQSPHHSPGSTIPVTTTLDGNIIQDYKTVIKATGGGFTMHYEKPIIVELSTGAMAQGGPKACMDGTAVTPVSCVGGSNDAACYAGTGGSQFPDDCLTGTSPGAPGEFSCLYGISAAWECAGGAAPVEYTGTCTAGPSVI
jgi:hypothetical protein